MNEYEKQARERKAIALIDTAMSAYDGEGFSAEDIEAFTDAQWELLADCAGVRPPSEVTKALVISSTVIRAPWLPKSMVCMPPESQAGAQAARISEVDAISRSRR